MIDDEGAQPRCEECGVLMRDIAGGWQCPACGHQLLPTTQIPVAPRFKGPAIHGG